MTKKNEVSVSKQTGNIQPPKQEPTDTCNSRMSSGSYCQKGAGWGTTHAGTGRCKLHGGMSTGRPKKNFSAAEYLNADIIRKFEEISDIDPNALTNLDNEINVIRANFYDYLKNPKMDKKGNVYPPNADTLKKFVDTLAKLIEVKAKLEGKITQQKIPTQLVVFYVNKVTTILERHIKDPDMRKQIAQEMRSVEFEPASNN